MSYWMLEIRNRDPVTNSDCCSLPVFEPGWVREAEWVNLDKEDVTKCGLHFTATVVLLRGKFEEICQKMTEFPLSAYEWWSSFILQKKSHALKLLEKVMYIVQLKLFICDCFHKKIGRSEREMRDVRRKKIGATPKENAFFALTTREINASKMSPLCYLVSLRAHIQIDRFFRKLRGKHGYFAHLPVRSCK